MNPNGPLWSTPHVGEAETEATGDVARALLAVLVRLGTQLQQLNAAHAALLAPDAPISAPRSSLWSVQSTYRSARISSGRSQAS